MKLPTKSRKVKGYVRAVLESRVGGPREPVLILRAGLTGGQLAEAERILRALTGEDVMRGERSLS